MPYAFVVPKEIVSKYAKDVRVHPVGTGAFRFKQWDEGSTLIFLKNPNYWRKDEAVSIGLHNDLIYAARIVEPKLERLQTFLQDSFPAHWLMSGSGAVHFVVHGDEDVRKLETLLSGTGTRKGTVQVVSDVVVWDTYTRDPWV